MSISENVQSVLSRINTAAAACGRRPDEIALVAATKMNSAENVAQAISAGIKICGENRVQELCEKYAEGAYKGAQLHFIGHLQRNKVRQLVGKCDLIQSVDSMELLAEIDSQAKKLGLRQNILLEVNIANEDSKSGFSPEEIWNAMDLIGDFPCIFVRGLMAIPPISHKTGENCGYFAAMKQLFVDIQAKKYDNVSMDFLSMGMSGDFEDAIAEGSNMVRVGSAIFGARPYTPRQACGKQE